MIIVLQKVLQKIGASNDAQVKRSRYNDNSHTMDILKMIAELRAERTAIEDAVAVLERLAHTRGKRRGRPPVWMSVIRGENSSPRRTRAFSAETKKKMAEAQKKRWAAYRKAQQAAASK